MKKTFLLVVALLVTVGAYARPICWLPYYVEAFGGANWMDSIQKDKSKIDFETGDALGVLIGYRCSPVFSLEGELSFRHNEVKRLAIGDELVNARGHFDSASMMVNGIYQFPIRHCGIIPYVGAGIGTRCDELTLKVPNQSNKGKRFHRTYEEHCGGAYQLIVGADLASWHFGRLGVEYRYQNRFCKDPGSHTVDLKLCSYF